jgi:hypothetical protein
MNCLAVPKFNFEGDACVLCETMAMYLQALLKEKSTEIAIRQALERLCNFLPSDTVAAVVSEISYLF